MKYVVIYGQSDGVSVSTVEAPSAEAVKAKILEDNDGHAVFVSKRDKDSAYWPDCAYLIIEGKIV